MAESFALLLVALVAWGCGEPGEARPLPAPVSAQEERSRAHVPDTLADAPASPPGADGAPGPRSPAAADLAAEAGPRADDDPAAPRFTRPTHLRGIYLNAWMAGSSVRTEGFIDLARRTEVNTFVIDVKDASGYVSYSTDVPLAKDIGADGEIRIRDVRGLLERLEAEEIWPIARIVVFKDPLLANARPDVAVQDSLGLPWVDGAGHVWVNPWNPQVWDYHIQLAREAIELGFAEVQWDYVRFPDRPASELAEAVFPGAEGRPRSKAVREFLERGRTELKDLDVPITADVFGMATSASQDVGIGQLWEDFADVVDAALPMVYPSHYWAGSFGYDEPNARPYEVVHEALRYALRRNEKVEGAGRIVPWIQDFTLGEPKYGVPEVRAQILAAHDVGIDEWILWNASGRYTEGALEPVDGWPGGVEPPIRFGSGIVPAAARFLEPDLEPEPVPPALPPLPDSLRGAP